MKNFVECSFDSQLLLDDCNQQIDRDCDPDLGFHGVLGSTIERFDSKILFDPFEEQLDLPATFEQQSNCQRWQDKVVCQKDKAAMIFDIEETDSPKRVGSRDRIEARANLEGELPACALSIYTVGS